MRWLIDARDWLTVIRLPTYAPDLNPTEAVNVDRLVGPSGGQARVRCPEEGPARFFNGRIRTSKVGACSQLGRSRS